jgi:hypothetical protein
VKAYQSTENLRYKLAPLFGKIEVTSVIAILRQLGAIQLAREFLVAVKKTPPSARRTLDGEQKGLESLF